MDFNKEKEKYLLEGYKQDWGDGALNNDQICIMQKWIEIPIENNKVKTLSNYVVITPNMRTVVFYNVEGYSS